MTEKTRRRPVQGRPRPGLRPARPAGGPLRLSVVRYLNTAPLVWGLEHAATRGRYSMKFTVPAGCAEDLRAGRAHVGILPTFAYQTIPGLKVIPHVSIASERKVESVLLVSRGPARRAKRVALDASSRTSAVLVRLLFALQWKKNPEYIEAAPDLRAMLSTADAALLIGDPALRFLLKAPGAQLHDFPNLHVYDLAEEWWRLTHLPFVFAFWAVRPEAAHTKADKERLVVDFCRSRDLGLEHLDEIARQAAIRLDLPGGHVERYLRYSIDYRLDAPHRAGLELFFRYAHEAGLLDKVQPVEFL